MMTSIKLMTAPVLLFALVACGKSDNNNNTAAIQYGVVNGSCYDITHNTPMPNSSYCSGTAGQYTYVGNQCVVAANPSQIVDPTYCQSSLYGNSGYGYGGGYYGGGPTYYPFGTGYANSWGSNYYPNTYGGGAYSGTQTCIGQYYQYNGFTAQLMTCNGFACRGLFLYSVQTRQRVLCM